MIPNEDERYILLEPKSVIGESCLLRIDYKDDKTFTLATVAFKSKHDEDWEHIEIESNVIFKNIQEMLASIQPTFHITYLTKQEAFIEIL